MLRLWKSVHWSDDPVYKDIGEQLCKGSLLHSQAALRAADTNTNPAPNGIHYYGHRADEAVCANEIGKNGSQGSGSADRIDGSHMSLPTMKTLPYAQGRCSMWLALGVKMDELMSNIVLYQGWGPVYFGHCSRINRRQLQDLCTA